MTEEIKTLKFLLDISTNIFIVTDIYGLVEYSNSKAKYAFENPNIIGTHISDVFDSHSSDKLLSEIHMVIQKQVLSSIMLHYRARYYNMFLYPDGNKVLICMEDTTEKMQIAEALYKTSQRLDFAEKTTKLGYWEMDMNNKSLFWSAEMYQIFGLNAKHISHKRNIIKEHILADDLHIYKNKIESLIRNGQPVEGIIRVRRTDGRIAYCSFKGSRLNEKGQNKIAGTFQDLTQLIETQIALEDAKKEADRHNMAKSYFLAQASHDLRQPMQALNIFISNLSDEKLTTKQTAIVNKIEASAENLKSLLDNLLDISKLDAGGVEYVAEEFNIGILLGNLAKEFEVLAKIKNIDFRFISTQQMVCSDPLLVERIIRNLLSNAFKYTKNKILLGCKKDRNSVKIMVVDNGIGIEKNELKYLFDDFYQSKKIAGNQRSGAGLGLSIVRKIASILHTKVEIETIHGKGSCFSFKLPIIKKNSGI